MKKQPLRDKLITAYKRHELSLICQEQKKLKEQQEKYIKERKAREQYLRDQVEELIRCLPKVLMDKADVGEKEYRHELLPYGPSLDFKDQPAIVRLKRYCSKNKLKLSFDYNYGEWNNRRRFTDAIISW
ncbi:MAG: hypothetical protein WC517_03695 [Patescibacteria group bacterium]